MNSKEHVKAPKDYFNFNNEVFSFKRSVIEKVAKSKNLNFPLSHAHIEVINGIECYYLNIFFVCGFITKNSIELPEDLTNNLITAKIKTEIKVIFTEPNTEKNE